MCKSHNLEYDSGENKNPRLIFYNDKDEEVKVRCTTFESIPINNFSVALYCRATVNPDNFGLLK